MPAGPDREAALDHLYRGQSNDCYWHGLFGGVYLADVRLAAHANLIAAEDAADTLAGAATQSTEADVDIDGLSEIVFESPGQVVVIKPDAGAAVAEWDVRGARHALAAVLRRRPEAYHRKLAAADLATGRGRRGRRATRRSPPGSNPSTRSCREKEPGLARLLIYDAYERRSGLVHLLSPDVTPADLAAATFDERADVLDQPYQVVELGRDHALLRRDATAGLDAGDQAIRVEKSFRIGGDRLRPTLSLAVRLTNRSAAPLRARLAVEWNLILLGGGGNPAAWYEIAGVRQPHDSSGDVAGATSVASGNTDIGLTLTTEVAPAADTWWYPIETISNSENGFERVYQGSSLVLSWPLHLAPGASLRRRGPPRSWTSRMIGPPRNARRSRAPPRDPRPARRPRPLLPAAPRRSVHGPRAPRAERLAIPRLE